MIFGNGCLRTRESEVTRGPSTADGRSATVALTGHGYVWRRTDRWITFPRSSLPRVTTPGAAITG